MKKVLFLCSNDGSDMRINKEVKSLSKAFEVDFLGIGLGNENSFVKPYCKNLIIIKGSRTSLFTYFKQVLTFLRLTFLNKYSSVHIVNEQLMIFYFPLLFFHNVVLDIFDSIFLIKGYPGDKLLWMKKILYAPVNQMLVTDSNRKRLMPLEFYKKIEILENYPFKVLTSKPPIEKLKKLTIMYYGWMGVTRGTITILNLIEASNGDIKIIMAGWFSDDKSRELSKHSCVDYRGTLSQEDANKVAQLEADYILCVYEPSNVNNINASPNKVYDAIQTNTPLIMNSEVLISSFVKRNKIGFILENYYDNNWSQVYLELKKLRGSYEFEKNFCDKYTWENIESKLINAHQN